MYQNRGMNTVPGSLEDLATQLAEICSAAALSVAPYLREVARTIPPYDTKSTMHDPVTVHDRAVELDLQNHLAQAIPGSLILGEEMGEQPLPGTPGNIVGADEGAATPPRASELGTRVRWIVDPIDGTANFAAGSTYFGTSVAAELDGDVVAGAITIPHTHELFAADATSAWHIDREGNRTELAATGATKESEALLVSYYPGTTALNEEPEQAVRLFSELCNAHMTVRRPGAAALDLAMTAAGWNGGLLATKLGPWDVAAGIHMVKVAGGKVINLPMGTDRRDGLRPGVLAALGSFEPVTAERILIELNEQASLSGNNKY